MENFKIILLLKGEFDLVSNHKEENIRRELEGIFSRKFPGITMYDFEFVKRDRNIISTPVVKTGHQWDFVHIKHLGGNGRLYFRLITSASRENIKQKDGTLVTGSENVVSSPSHEGGVVASWLVRSTPERALRVRALAWDIALCS